MNRQSSKDEIQILNKHVTKCSLPLVIGKMQIKTALRSHLTSVRMAIIKKINSKFWQGCGKKETLARCWWGC